MPSRALAGQVELEGHIVSEQDVCRAISACDVPDYGEVREVLHAQPVNFALDSRSGLIDPRGQMGRVLATVMHMLTVDAAAIQNLAHCIKRCDPELAGLASSAYVSGISSLLEDEQKLNCSEASGFPVNPCRLGSTKRVGAASAWFQPNRGHPLPHKPAIFAR